MPISLSSRFAALVSALLFSLCAIPTAALVIPRATPFDAKAFSKPELFIPQMALPLDRLPVTVIPTVTHDLAPLDGSLSGAFYDPRSDRWGGLILTHALIPGTGYGNHLTWQGLGMAPPATTAELEAAVDARFRNFISTFASQLRIDPSEVGELRIGVIEEGHIIHVYAPRVYQGMPVHQTYLSATINSGNLILFGSHSWGALSLTTQAGITAQAAEAAAVAYAQPYSLSLSQPARLEIMPIARGYALGDFLAGQGYGYRLVWIVDGKVAGQMGSWESYVDAMTGEVLAFMDINQYFTRKITGGVYPVSNDQIAPDGVEVSGFPMGLANQKGVAGSFSNLDGVLNVTATSFSTDLSGKYLKISDLCGAINEVAPVCGNLDLGSGPNAAATDCTKATGHSAGDTKSTRTGFAELNQLIASVQPLLPNNNWMKGQLTANMNLNQTCNAYWSSPTINFFKTGPANGCANTGEIAAVFDHEWGHGLDNNGTNNNIAPPGEAIADNNATVRQGQSCSGRGFVPADPTCLGSLQLPGFLGGYGDPCTACTGIRDSDYAKHASGLPHGIDWVLSETNSPGVPGVFPQGGCIGVVGVGAIPVVTAGPCNVETHCEGSMAAGVAWDLFDRDLRAAPFTLDFSSALQLSQRLWVLGDDVVGSMYQCAGIPNPSAGVAGCLSDSAYMSVLGVDDDNGNLNDGTPHMTAISAAFTRHQMQCVTPTVTRAGCAAGPTAAPTVIAAAMPGGASLSWNAVAGATKYYIFRTEGPHGCNFGKVRVGTTTGNGSTSFIETGLLPGLNHYYAVQAIGANDSCASPLSACSTVVPASTPAGHCNGSNTLPVAVADAASTTETTLVTITVLTNDSDADGDTLTVTGVSSPANGTATINPDSTLRYTPNTCFSGVDTFTYTVSDGFGGSATANVTVTVTGDGNACFSTVSPCRVYDSRLSGGPLASGVQRAITLAEETCGIPLTAIAVSFNVTAAGATDAGNVTLAPDAGPLPSATATVNFNAGETRANNSVMALDFGGTGTIVAQPSIPNGGTVQLIIDVNGYFE